MPSDCVNCSSPLEGRAQCGHCGMFAPAPSTQSSPRLRPAPAPVAAGHAHSPVDEAEGGTTRARVRLTGIRSYMAAVRAAEASGGPLPAPPVVAWGQPAAPAPVGAPTAAAPAPRLRAVPTPDAPVATVVPGGPTPVAPRSNHTQDKFPAEQHVAPAPVRAPAPGPVAHPAYAAARPAVSPGPAYAPAPPARPARAPRPPRAVPLDNPFRRLRPADALADLAALLLLTCTLLLPWDASRAGHDVWWVVVVAAVVALSLAVPYVMTARLVPAFRPEHSATMTFALGLPALAVALGAVLGDLVAVATDRPGGIGVGVATLVAGTALAVQPRASEEVLAPVGERTVGAAAVVTGVVAVVLQVVAFAAHVVHGSGAGLFAGQGLADWTVLLVLTLALPVTVLGVPAVSHAMGRTSGRRVLAVVATTSLVVTALAAAGVPAFGSWAVVESWTGPSGGGFVVGAAAALALSGAAVRRTGAGVDPAVGWQQTARLALWVCAGGAAWDLVVTVSVLAVVDGAGPAAVAVVLLLALVVLAASVAGILLVDLRRRTTVVATAAFVALAGVAVWVLGPAGLTPARATVLLALPALAAGALLVPGSVRARARTLRTVAPPASWAPPAPWTPPVQRSAPPAPPRHLAAYESEHTVPRVYEVPAPHATFVQSTGVTQSRRMPSAGAPTVPPPGQPWSGWQASRSAY